MILEKKVQLERMTWVQVKDAVKESNGVAVFAVGATEQHGPHNPLCCDAMAAHEATLRAARKARVVMAPTIPIGNCLGSMGFPGTLYLKPDTLKAVVKDICRSLIHHGFDKIVIVNGHGGNYGCCIDAAEEIKYETGAQMYHCKIMEMEGPPIPSDWPLYDAHGGTLETSLMLYLCPDDVDRTKFVDSEPVANLTKYAGPWLPWFATLPPPKPISAILAADECSEYGHGGDPSKASKEWGEKAIEMWSDQLGQFLKALKEDKIKYLKKSTYRIT